MFLFYKAKRALDKTISYLYVCIHTSCNYVCLNLCVSLSVSEFIVIKVDAIVTVTVGCQ